MIGPAGMVGGQVENVDDIASLMIEAGALRHCTRPVRARLRALYADEDASRTAAFFESILADPARVPDLIQRLSGIRAVIFGCGGIGTGTAYLLAGLGVKRFLLRDGDTIERSNLNRQFLYTLDDIGRYKAEVLSRELQRRFVGLEIETDLRMIAGDELGEIGKNDHVIVSADDPPDMYFNIRNSISDMEVPVWNAGYLLGVSKVAKLRGGRRARPAGTWRKASTISTSVGFQNFEVCARLAFAIALDATTGYDRDYYFDYRKLLPGSIASGGSS